MTSSTKTGTNLYEKGDSPKENLQMKTSSQIRYGIAKLEVEFVAQTERIQKIKGKLADSYALGQDAEPILVELANARAAREGMHAALGRLDKDLFDVGNVEYEAFIAKVEQERDDNIQKLTTSAKTALNGALGPIVSKAGIGSQFLAELLELTVKAISEGCWSAASDARRVGPGKPTSPEPRPVLKEAD